MPTDVRKVRARLREFALGLPEVHEDLPWGERVVKVNKKVFVFLGRDMDTHFGLGVKLPVSNKSALALPFTEPTGYGLGKSGWVSAKLEAGTDPAFDLLREWVLESYCAVASKTLAAQARASASTPVKLLKSAKSAAPIRTAKSAPASKKRTAKAAARVTAKPRAKAKTKIASARRKTS